MSLLPPIVQPGDEILLRYVTEAERSSSAEIIAALQSEEEVGVLAEVQEPSLVCGERENGFPPVAIRASAGTQREDGRAIVSAGREHRVPKRQAQADGGDGVSRFM